jgi:hypothetical protein
MALRLAIEPMTFTYYAAGLVLAAAMFDLVAWRRPMPVMTAVSWGYMLAFSNYVSDPYARAWLRLVSTAGCLVLAVVGALMMRRREMKSDRPQAARGRELASAA